MANPVYDYVETNGVIVTDTFGILAEVQAEYQGVFGNDLVVTPDTPQGVLITAEALARTAAANNNAALANQINPNLAGGIFLDAICALTGKQRISATSSIVTAQLTGVAGTVIPFGSQAQTVNGDLFALQQSVTLGSGGTGTGVFVSVATGPIPINAGILTQIVNGGVLGWETITNASAGTLGTNQESDEAVRISRLNMLAFQGQSLAMAITSALHNVSGVQSLWFQENYTSAPMGMLISVTGGTTLHGTVQALSTTSGSGTNGGIVVDADSMNFSVNGQTIPASSPWPIAAFTTTGNITLSGLGTQSGGDWPSTLTAGQIILVKNQTTASQNGIWLAASGSWTRGPYNASGATIQGSLNGISMISHSVYACVNGGTSTAVAKALLENKSSGCGWNGSTTVNVTEPASGQVYPVSYDVPTQIPILVRVTLGANTAPTNATTDVEQAVTDYAAGNVNGEPGLVVGGNVSPFEIAGAINSEFPTIYVRKVEVALASTVVWGTSEIIIGVNQIATITPVDITVLTT